MLKYLAPAAILLMAFPAILLSSEVQTGQTPQHFEKKNGDIILQTEYLLFLPAEYGKDPARKWPLMLFLHGSGERGTDINLVKKNGPPKIVEQKPDFPFIVISPQCPPKTRWNIKLLSALLDDVSATYAVDSDRVYLTGLSMGGFAAWALAAKEPERFAAVVPMCGGGDPTTAQRMRNLHFWVFHGEKDTSVPVQKDQEMVDALHSPSRRREIHPLSGRRPQLLDAILCKPRVVPLDAVAPSWRKISCAVGEVR